MSTYRTALAIALTAALWLGLAAPAAAATAAIPWKTPEYTLLAREMPLAEALNAFGTAQGMPVVVSKEVAGVVYGDFRAMPPQEFLERLAAMYNLAWYYDGAALYIYGGSQVETLLLDLKYMKAEEVTAMLRELGVEDERFPLKTADHDELVLVSGPPRYVQLISALVDKADRLREKRAYSQVETRIFPLKHTWADDVNLPVSGGEGAGQIKGVAKMLEEMVRASTSTPIREGDAADKDKDPLAEAMDRSFQPVIKAENRLNAVVVRDAVSRMPLYEKLIAQLDVPLQLVEIAVTSLDLSKDDALDWQLSLAARGNKRRVTGAAGQSAGSLFGLEDLAGAGLTGALSYIGNSIAVSASLSALRQKGKARSISRTSILTMNNMAASVTDTQSYHARVVGTEVASLEEVSAGTSLVVKPRIVPDSAPDLPRRLWMTVSLADGGFEAIAVDSMPLTRSSTVTTQTAVYEDECILLAGYLRDIEEEAHWGIPFLRDIPYIGWLFGGVSKKTETVQRMFILTPYVVDLDEVELARLQARRQRDITREETLQDDKKDDDDERELRDLERQERDDARREHTSDRLSHRRQELELQRQQRQAQRQEDQDRWEQEFQARKAKWEEQHSGEHRPLPTPELLDNPDSDDAE